LIDDGGALSRSRCFTLPDGDATVLIDPFLTGGHYTMDRSDAADAPRLIGARTVIPCHYNTFPPIETDAQAFKADVESATSASVVVLDPGETHST
jgi:L-ascorbate metabolism protein UlaG (beta-lactamase superfamily)